MTEITITRPDDWHLHLRDDEAMQAVVAHTAERFGRAIVMPNLRPPVTTTEQALAYRDRILKALPEGSAFEPLMTLYLTDNTPPEEIEKAAADGAVKAVKLYPAGATTNSDSGLTDIHKAEATLQKMAEVGMPLLVHGEVTAKEVDIFDREARFLDEVLKPLIDRIPDLKVVAEHITTKEMAEFVLQASDNVAATITPQHLLYNRNAMLVGGIRPHFYCLPILKREIHREKLIEVATSGNPKFFLGTDSAPHAKGAKESACGCAGVYSAHAAIEFYAEAFDAAGALDKLEGFASHFGADFYGLPRNSDTITLKKESWEVPESYPFGDEKVIPLRAGNPLNWKATN
ncbi:dihydroorotase [Solemya pervernicosa gill symbiont]|uniref:Dihydroorotase n=1 Tax=Solemya pervernicosa gill symbiont TaxID=642797 RepID=A0A1T2L675_9GAMM|nr:dihydroorotase [Solemya pervernicosa gill symbiont]OOZ40554.1 dihydroorotase [Solemya pervernicosa gill symbiont]